MPALAAGGWSIALVESLTDTETETLAKLHVGQVVQLDRHRPDWPGIRERLKDGNRRQIPVGIWLDQEGRITAAAWAERDFLLNVLEQGPRPGWVWVYFATGGSYALRRSNPDYHRIIATVQHCRETRSPAWMVTTQGADGIELVDLRVLPTEEDDLLCRLGNLGWA